jgi:hypothetical protein
MKLWWLIWRASLATRRQCDNAPFVASDKTTIRKGNNDKGSVVAIDNAARKVYIIHHMKRFFYDKTNRFLWYIARCVVDSVVAMSLCRLAYKPILRFEPSGIVTFGVWRKSLARG